jgi:hypothetical protein
MVNTLDQIKEKVSELTKEQRTELQKFLEKLDSEEHESAFFYDTSNVQPIMIRLPGESEAEHEARIQAFLVELEETAIDIDSDAAEDIRQIREKRDEDIWRAASL